MRDRRKAAAKGLCLLLAMCMLAGTLCGCRGNRLSREELALLEAGPTIAPGSVSVPHSTVESESVPVGESESAVPESDSSSVPVSASSSTTQSDSSSVPESESSSAGSSASQSASAAQSVSSAAQSSSSAAQSTSSAPESSAPPAVQPTPADGAVNPYSCWYYDRLNPAQQQLYRELYTLFAGYDTAAEVTLIPPDAAYDAYAALENDHPELFWMEGYTYYTQYQPDGSELVNRIERVDSMDRSTRDAFAAQVEQEKSAILAGMDAALPANASQTQKAQYLFEYLALNTTYVTGSPYNQTLVSCLVNRQSVCAGYARAYQALLTECGIFCTFIPGFGDGESHAWSLFRLDGGWYYSDVTWGDSDTVCQNGQELIKYQYFAVTYDWLSRSHVPDEDIWPRTTDTAANWFVRNGALMENWDPAQAEAVLWNCAANREPFLLLQFTNAAAMQRAVDAAANGEVNSFFANVAVQYPLKSSNIYYIPHDQTYTLAFALEYTD